MKTILKILFVSFVVLCFFLYLQRNYVNRFNNDIEIFQIENPNKEQFEKNIELSYPTIFTSVSQNFKDIQKYSLKSLKEIEPKEKNKLDKNIKRHFKYYDTPLNSRSSINILSESAGTSNTVTRQGNYRYMITQLKGVKTIYLFAPKNRKYLYAKGDKSQIDFFTDNLLEYPKLSETKYIEIVLYPGQMLYIPYNWWFNYKNTEDSFAVYHKSDSIFSKYLLKK